MSITLKTESEISKMRKANLVVARVLRELKEMVAPGVSTADLDSKAMSICKEENVRPAFLGYPAMSPDVSPFSGVICASVNEEIVHGVPNPLKKLKEGDVISIDFGCEYEGYFGDAAVTVPIGEVAPNVKKLLEATEHSLNLAIEQCRAGNRIGDISNAVQSHVEKLGFNVVREFVGHGIGTAMHEPPHVPNFGSAGKGRILKPGMVLAIEPMVVEGSFSVKILEDGWTAVTADGGFAAHFEHSVAITKGAPIVLSLP